MLLSLQWRDPSRWASLVGGLLQLRLQTTTNAKKFPQETQIFFDVFCMQSCDEIQLFLKLCAFMRECETGDNMWSQYPSGEVKISMWAFPRNHEQIEVICFATRGGAISRPKYALRCPQFANLGFASEVLIQQVVLSQQQKSWLCAVAGLHLFIFIF